MKHAGLIWNESQHGIGIASLDEQHRQIVEQVNRVISAIEDGASSEAMHELMDGLILLARQHFGFEERLMSEYGFPGLEGHAREHLGLLQKLDMFNETLFFSDPHRLKLILAFVTDWAELHLLKGEKVLGEYLASKGLS
ncbi:MAG: hemerythrin family protein [Sulfuricella sp.]